MRFFRRLVTWITFLGVVAGVGTGTFWWIRQRPRCVIQGELRIVHLADDGSRIVTLRSADNTGNGPGPMLVWDTASAQTTSRHLDNAGHVRLSFAADGRTVAADPGDGTLRLIDWIEGAERTLRLSGPHSLYEGMAFSPHGDWLFVRLWKERLTDVYINVPEGTVALRHDPYFHGFFGDTGIVMVNKDDLVSPVSLVDLRTGTDVGELANASALIASSPSGKQVSVCIVTEVERKRAGDEPVRLSELVFELWEVRTPRRLFRHKEIGWVTKFLVFSPEDRYLAAVFSHPPDGDRLTVWDTTSGRVLLKEKLAFVKDFSIAKFDDQARESLALIIEHLNDHARNPARATMLNLKTGQQLWAKNIDDRLSILGEGGQAFVKERGHGVRVLDQHTGEPLGAALQDLDMGGPALQFAPDGRHLLVHGWRTHDRPPQLWEGWLAQRWPEVFGVEKSCHSVLDTATGQELFRVMKYGNANCFLSNDGSTLVTVDGLNPNPNIIRIWDVHPHRAWTWAIATSLLTGLSLYSLRRGLRWLLRKPLPSAA